MDVRIRGLSLERGGRIVLDVPSLDFPAGSVNAVFGPNGSGKTSLLRCIAGLERFRGEIAIDGRQVTRGDRRVALAFQEPVFLHESVRANLSLGLALRGVPPAERAARIAAMAEECGLVEVLDRSAWGLSSGESQRANLARTLALAAPVTLLDEPLSGFDRIGRVRMLEEIPALLSAHATTAIIVTHDREEAYRLADRLVLLVGGRVAAAGAAGAIYRDPPDEQTARLLGYAILPHGSRRIGVPPGALRPGEGEVTFRIVVVRAVDMGNHGHLIGRLRDGARRVTVEVRLDPDARADAPGTELSVHPTRWIEFGSESRVS
jgi:ABC-type sugar transport system ATPase subunit